MKQPKAAIKELKEILDDKYDDNIVNLICDLYIQLNEFYECIELLESLNRKALPLDIDTKKGYCLARLGRLLEADSCFENLLKHSVVYYDDLYLLVGSLYMDLDQHESALKFFEPLLALERHNKPDLWFKCGKLYYEIGDLISSEEAFKSVLDSQEYSLLTQSKLFLAKIYKSKGEIDKSIHILKTKTLDIEDGSDLTEEFIENLISNAKLKIEESYIKKDLNDLYYFLDQLIDTELKLELRKKEDIVESLGQIVLNETFERVIEYLIIHSMYSQGKEFIIKLLKMNMYKDLYRLNMKKLLTKLCILDEDYDQALNSYKYVCEKENTESNWIAISGIMRKTEKPQLRSWLCKLSSRDPHSYAVHMLLGNSYFQTGNYALAIKQYSQVYDIDDALINLQIGLCHLFSLCSRNIHKKEEVFAKAFKYLKIYVKIRKKKNYVEAYYNLGRAFHHVQYYTKASYYYEKVLMYCSRTILYSQNINSELQKYAKLAVNNLIAIRNSLDDLPGAEKLASLWIDYL
jgi:tetratricopeptide (TPR) repeat protein